MRLIAAISMLSGCGTHRPIERALNPVEQQELSLTFTFFNLKEGDATYVVNRSTDCEEHILIDAGNVVAGTQLAQRLIYAAPLDLFIITHPHPDHIGGAAAVIELLKPRAVFDNGQQFTHAELAADPWLRMSIAHMRSALNYQALRAPRTLALRCGGMLTVLSPPQSSDDVRWNDSNWNRNSLVFLIERNNTRVLIMGDALIETEQHLLASSQRRFLTGIDLFRVGHHGSRYASSESFLKFVQPTLSIVSSGSENSYGYPHTDSLERIARYSDRMLRTDRSGTIQVRFDLRNSEAEYERFSVTEEHTHATP